MFRSSKNRPRHLAVMITSLDTPKAMRISFTLSHKTRNIYGFVNKISDPQDSAKSAIIIRNTDFDLIKPYNNSTPFDLLLKDGRICEFLLRRMYGCQCIMYIYSKEKHIINTHLSQLAHCFYKLKFIKNCMKSK